MIAVKAVYDESKFVLDEPVPVKGKYEVVITFTNPVKKDQRKLLEYAGMFDTGDVQLVQDMIDDRENFFKDRQEV
ncbi:hypothetical protein AGMMS49944_05120 [Spirochaetia bacterium]|nr:hypothetical protein AGMMS49944_05120 [Spirochaetia bacterium]